MSTMASTNSQFSTVVPLQNANDQARIPAVSLIIFYAEGTNARINLNAPLRTVLPWGRGQPLKFCNMTDQNDQNDHY